MTTATRWTVEEEELITRRHVALANRYFIQIAKDDWKEAFYHPGRSLKDSATERIKREAEAAAHMEWENRMKIWSPWIPAVTSLLGVLLGSWIGHAK